MEPSSHKLVLINTPEADRGHFPGCEKIWKCDRCGLLWVPPASRPGQAREAQTTCEARK